MNLDELQSVQARERQSSDLQHLRASFYREVGEFVRELTVERAEAVEAADDPFDSPAVRRLSDDIETAEQTVEAIYERRVGKVVKKASIAAAGMPVDDDGLTDEEAELFDDLVARIQQNRETVLAALDGKPPTESADGDDAAQIDGTRGADPRPSGAATPGTDGTGDEASDGDGRGEDSPDDGVSAADLMGESDPGSGPDSTPTDHPSGSSDPPERTGGDSTATDDDADPPVPDPEDVADAGEGPGATGSDDSARAREGADDVPGLPRTTVRITADVGEVVGADDRDYDLSPADVVTLPEANAEVLLDKGAAERLE